MLLPIIQNFIDKPIDPIYPRIVRDKDLETTDLQWLVGSDSDSPRSVGISPAYSQSGGLLALACVFGTRTLIIKFHSSNADHDSNSSRTQRQIRERHNRLEEGLLCNPHCTHYAFDLAPLALSLHLHFNVHLANAIDIQSALPVTSRDVIDSVKFIIGDAFPFWVENITSAFEIKSNKEKDDLIALVQRAWLCHYLGQCDLGNVKDMFSIAPKVDVRVFSEQELEFLQKVAYDTLRQDLLKPQLTAHEVETYWDSTTGLVVAESKHYSNRITTDTSIQLTVALGPSASLSVTGEAVTVRGSVARIGVEHNLEDQVITSITSIGRVASTWTETKCNHAILRMLQRSLAIFDNHWIKAIWCPSQPICWPEYFSPPPDDPATEISEHPDTPLNNSQSSAIAAMLSQSFNTCISLVQGPPGTGKTTVVATYVISAIKAGQRGIWLMAQSNFAVKAIAEKLAKLGFLSFKLLISRSFYSQWYEHLYKEIESNVILPGNLSRQGALEKVLQGAQVILCTLDMLSNPKLQDLGLTQAVPVINVIIDEASQIEVSQYIPLFNAFGTTLRKLCFIGDDKQLPPHAQDNLGDLESIFERGRLRNSVSFLDTQYRMPPQIGDFISHHVYDGRLKSNPHHRVRSGIIACHFVDVHGCEKVDQGRKSPFNQQEVKAVVLLARHLQDEDIPYRIITPYEAQRSAIEKALKAKELNWHDKCFNVDAFQGSEDQVIIISLVRTKKLGFLKSWQRTNVMLTRCKRHMYIVSSKAFLKGRGAKSLVGKMAIELGKQPGVWLTQQNLEDGKFD